MTDHPDDLDELASAALDGQVDSDERARIGQDPALQARVASFAVVRERLAAPVDPLDEASRSELMAAALNAAGDTSAAPADGDVIELQAALERERRRAGRWRLAGVAAAVLAALAIPLAVIERTSEQKFDEIGAAIGGGEQSDVDRLTADDSAENSRALDGAGLDAAEPPLTTVLPDAAEERAQDLAEAAGAPPVAGLEIESAPSDMVPFLGEISGLGADEVLALASGPPTDFAPADAGCIDASVVAGGRIGTTMRVRDVLTATLDDTAVLVALIERSDDALVPEVWIVDPRGCRPVLGLYR